MWRARMIAAGLRCLLMAGILAAPLIAAGPAQAITNGQPDGNRHPNVGLMVVDFGSGPTQWCTGTLIAPTYFLIAGHCISLLQEFGGTVDGVTFDEIPTLDGTSTVIPAQAVTVDPAF